MKYLLLFHGNNGYSNCLNIMLYMHFLSCLSFGYFSTWCNSRNSGVNKQVINYYACYFRPQKAYCWGCITIFYIMRLLLKLYCIYRVYTKELCGFKSKQEIYFSPYTCTTYTVNSGNCPSFSCATSSSLLMLTAGPRGQFPRWRRSRKRLFVCSVLRCPDLWLQCSVSFVHGLEKTHHAWCVFSEPCTAL